MWIIVGGVLSFRLRNVCRRVVMLCWKVGVERGPGPHWVVFGVSSEARV